MSADSVPDQGVGRISSGISTGTLTQQTLQFVYKSLPVWRDDPHRPDEKSEDRLNLQLCKFLASTAREFFPMVRFDHEEYQEGQRAVDLSASPSEIMLIGAKEHSIYEPFLVLECKRLPAPSKDREKEYVTGFKRKSGGIQRFKMGFHGSSQSIAAIVGYVQNESTKNWHDSIRDWIRDLSQGKIEDTCSWSKDEFLKDFEADSSNRTSRCRSVHPRNGIGSANTIELHHLWVEMNSKTSGKPRAKSERGS